MLIASFYIISTWLSYFLLTPSSILLADWGGGTEDEGFMMSKWGWSINNWGLRMGDGKLRILPWNIQSICGHFTTFPGLIKPSIWQNPLFDCPTFPAILKNLTLEIRHFVFQLGERKNDFLIIPIFGTVPKLYQ